MARLLYEKESSSRHLQVTRLHMRRCVLIKGAEKYASSIEPQFNELKRRSNATSEKAELRENAYDAVIYYDSELDGESKDLFNACERYDRRNPGELILKKIFPDGKFSVITMQSRKKQHTLTEGLLLRLENLGQEHQLFPISIDLRNALTLAVNAEKAYEAAELEEKKAVTEELIAQAALRNQYEKNYLTSRNELGKKIAEKLFPPFATKKKTVVNDAA